MADRQEQIGYAYTLEASAEGERKNVKGRYITLYHFCAAQDISSILGTGLTKGCTPIWENGKLHAERKTQWLTTDKEPGRQSWNTRHVLPYSRTAYRLTINIPSSYNKKLVSAKSFIEQYPAENASLITGWPGSENWFVFRGIIPPSWIVGHKKMEESQ